MAKDIDLEMELGDALREAYLNQVKMMAKSKKMKVIMDEWMEMAGKDGIGIGAGGAVKISDSAIESFADLGRIYLGDGFAAKVTEQMGQAVAESYREAQLLMAKKSLVGESFTQQDAATIQALHSDSMYWIKTGHDRHVVPGITKIVAGLVEQGYGRKEGAKALWEALDKKYQVEAHRWDVVASAAIVRARATGALNTMETLGITTYEWQAVGDEAMCPICGKLNGQTWEVASATKAMKEATEAGTPEAWIDALPWYGTSKGESGEMQFHQSLSDGTKRPVDLGKLPYATPPAHGRCRCELLEGQGEISQEILDIKEGSESLKKTEAIPEPPKSPAKPPPPPPPSPTPAPGTPTSPRPRKPPKVPVDNGDPVVPIGPNGAILARSEKLAKFLAAADMKLLDKDTQKILQQIQMQDLLDLSQPWGSELQSGNWQMKQATVSRQGGQMVVSVPWGGTGAAKDKWKLIVLRVDRDGIEFEASGGLRAGDFKQLGTRVHEVAKKFGLDAMITMPDWGIEHLAQLPEYRLGPEATKEYLEWVRTTWTLEAVGATRSMTDALPWTPEKNMGDLVHAYYRNDTGDPVLKRFLKNRTTGRMTVYLPPDTSLPAMRKRLTERWGMFTASHKGNTALNDESTLFAIDQTMPLIERGFNLDRSWLQHRYWRLHDDAAAINKATKNNANAWANWDTNTISIHRPKEMRARSLNEIRYHLMDLQTGREPEKASPFFHTTFGHEFGHLMDGWATTQYESPGADGPRSIKRYWCATDTTIKDLLTRLSQSRGEGKYQRANTAEMMAEMTRQIVFWSPSRRTQNATWERERLRLAKFMSDLSRGMARKGNRITPARGGD